MSIIKRNKGITLTTLAVTIIILLILSGISISIVTGENGIINQIKKAKEETKRRNILEDIQIIVIETSNSQNHLDFNKLKDKLAKEMPITAQEYDEKLIVNYEKIKFVIDQEGKVKIWDGIETQANIPKLGKGMIPLKYNSETEKWVICTEEDKDWYNYSIEEKKWANIMLSDGKYDTTAIVGTEIEEDELGSMFVWIPRYAYKITSGYHSNSGSIDVIWVNGKSYEYIDSNGDVHIVQNGNTEGIITSEGYSDYVLHPAFANGKENEYSNGEWKEEIEGIWVAKFQAGIYTTENDTEQKVSDLNNYYYPIFKGKKYAYNYLTVVESYELAQKLDDANNPYGITSLSNSHLMKNSEWGAVAYLSISQYGYSGGNSLKEKTKNNLSIIESDNVAASPVSNPNNSEYKATSITGYSATSGKAEGNIMTYTSVNDLTDQITKGFNEAYNELNTIFGDAIYETSSGVGEGMAWFGQTLEEDENNSVEGIMQRGGHWNHTTTVGLCGLFDGVGNAANPNYGFRSVLILE